MAVQDRAPSPFAPEPLFAATGFCLGLALLATIPAMLLDNRLLQNENIWIKPIKFQLALCLLMLTLAFFARYLPSGMTARKSYRIYAKVVVFTVVAEMVWIGGAAMFGVGSHYNDSSTLMAVLYPIMGIFAITLTTTTLVYGIAIWRNTQTDLHPALKLSIALGLCLTFMLTLPVASTLSAGTGHFVGIPVTGETVPFIGWSREVGDLRVAHFFATHAMHFVPLMGLIIASIFSTSSGNKLVWLLAIGFTGFVAFTFLQALGGQPLLPLT